MSYDLLVIGGGINGAAIARDAAGRGWKTLLVEKDDLASHTSSSSSKLIHGGIRYLEFYEFKLVRKALKERETMLKAAPHLIWPMRFVMPHNDDIRAYWMIRSGLLLYDLLAGFDSLPRTKRLGKANPRYRSPLRDAQTKGYVYSDCWVDDSRLVVANAMDAAAHGADIATRTAFEGATRAGPIWQARLSDGRQVEARAIVNAAGPWVGEVLHDRIEIDSKAALRLVRGSHIVVDRIYNGDHAYIFQMPDRRIVFALPYLDRFTLIGTTEVAVDDPAAEYADEDEIAYLCDAANYYFAWQLDPDQVVSHYSGVRSLYDDGASDAREVTRDYVLELDGGSEEGVPPLLSVFGGKITTARALAEDANDRLAAATPFSGAAWTKRAKFPGGETGKDVDAFVSSIQERYPFLKWEHAVRLVRAYGSMLPDIFGEAATFDDLGGHFGEGLTVRELEWMCEREWAKSADDALMRRSKLGLLLDEATVERVNAWFAERSA